MSTFKRDLLQAIPQDRKGKNSLLHTLFLLTGKISLLKSGYLLPFWIANIWFASQFWGTQWHQVAFISVLTIVTDWVVLALLPVKRRSWGPVTPPLVALTLLRTGLSVLLSQTTPGESGPAILFLINAGLSATAFYATWIEPLQLGVTHQQFKLPNWPASRPLRLLHISDIHFEGETTREKKLLAEIETLNPDLIILTGDYLNLSSVHDGQCQEGARRLLSQMQAPLGVYAVTGSPAVDVEGIIPDIFAGLPVHWLNDEALPITWHGAELWILGIRCTIEIEEDIKSLRQVAGTLPTDVPTLLLYHTPDLMPEATKLNISLYRDGHTHGGQLRLPVYGAIFTSSRWGKRYEMGLYREKHTTLYVSRGIGLEGLGAPRARFLAPPELILWEISPTTRQG